MAANNTFPTTTFGYYGVGGVGTTTGYGGIGGDSMRQRTPARYPLGSLDKNIPGNAGSQIGLSAGIKMGKQQQHMPHARSNFAIGRHSGPGGLNVR